MTSADEFLLSDDHADVDILLSNAIQKLECGSAADAFEALDLFWARLAMHIRAEHLHLFPAVLKENETVDADVNLSSTLERLRRDHDYFMHELADSIKAMRLIDPSNESEITRATAGRLQAIRTRLAEHNVVEEKVVYPLRQLLSESDQEQLLRSITKEITNLPSRLGKENAARFAALRKPDRI